MKKKTLMRGLAGMLAAGMLCLMPVTSYVNAAEQGYVQTTERSCGILWSECRSAGFRHNYK